MKSCMFVVPSLSDGGAERVVSIFSSSLAALIESVYVVSYWDTKFNYCVDERVHLICLSGGSKSDYERMKSLDRIKKLRGIIQHYQPEVVIPFLPHVCLQTTIAAFGLTTTVVQTVRNNPRTSPPESNRRIIRDILVMLSKCTLVQNEEQLEYFPHFMRKRMQILPNPILDTFFQKSFCPPQDVFRVVGVGRLIEQKNFLMLLVAFSEFAKKYENVELQIYGEGALRDNLQKEIEALKLEGKAKLCGRTNNIADVLASSSVFVLSSDFEGMPNSLMEAMAVGIPVIATDCPTGPKELLAQGERGILVPMGNSDALREALVRVYLEYENAKHKAVKAREYVSEQYRTEKIVSRLLDMMSSLRR